MNKFYITGIPGTGKTTVIEELKKRGIRAYDVDQVLGLCHWKNKRSGERAEYQSGIGREWLEAHSWVCDEEKLAKLIELETDTPVIIAGITANQDKYSNLFDKVYLLHCNEETFLHRLDTRDGKDNFAKDKSEQQQILEWYKNFENRVRKSGAISINTENSVSRVADEVVSYIVSN